MTENDSTYKFSVKELPKFLVILLGVVVIGFLFPNNSEFKYDYEIGQSWTYEDLYAEKDFTAHISVQQGVDNDSLINSTVFYKNGSLLVSRNQFITKALDQTLDQYLAVAKSKIGRFSTQGLIYLLGYFLLTALIIGALILYAWKFFPQSTRSFRAVVFLMMWPVLFSIIEYFVGNREGLSSYVIPFCITPIIVSNFYNGRLALVVHIVVILILSFVSDLGYEFTFIQILAGIVAVLVLTETRFWNKFFLGILMILCTYLLAYLGLALINSGTIMPEELSTLGWLSINCIFLLLAYPFIPMLEKIFGFTSSITLAELGDMNKALLKELSLKAPEHYNIVSRLLISQSQQLRRSVPMVF